MSIQTIQDLLPRVEMPSRYLGTERNAIRKDWQAVSLKIALAFPDLYEIGTSHFGLQILYHILNAESDILAERVFAPAEDMEAQLRTAGLPLSALESGRPLADFDIIGFSLLYELNYTNILNMLELAGLGFWAHERTETDPLVIGGGPCAVNPEPVAAFFDAIVVGDGEGVILDICRAWQQWRRQGGSKEALLTRWAAIDGVYVPSLYEVTYDAAGLPSIDARAGAPARVRRTVVADLDAAKFPDAPILPFGRPVHDRLRLEISRGCTRGCRFCQAGMIYRPVRERSPANLIALAKSALARTGYEDLSLLSLSTSDYACISELMAALMGRCANDHVAVSLPSLRAGTLTPELMALIKAVRKTGFTIAPEAGSDRLRRVINKNITDADIVHTVENAFSLGWRVIKLYFMIGLPTETQDDLAALVALVQRLKSMPGRHNRGGKIHVSVTTFIPKAHTPFQWASQIDLDTSKTKLRWIKERLNQPGVQVKWQDPAVSVVEGLWARGDRRLAKLLVAAHEEGCKFDGWSDKFNLRRWQEAFQVAGIDPAFYTQRQRSLDEPLPWDHIDARLEKDFLKAEWRQGLDGIQLDDCRDGACHECGACDFRQVAPDIVSHCDLPERPAQPRSPSPNQGWRRLQVTFAKTGPARFFGHLELVSIMIRAIRRAGIPLKHSEGFHPMPKIAFADPLPLGMESLAEFFFMTVADHVKPSDVTACLNEQMPIGLEIKACILAGGRRLPTHPVAETYRIRLTHPAVSAEKVAAFNARTSLVFEKITKKGRRRRIDLKEVVRCFELSDGGDLLITLIRTQGRVVRPADLLRRVFGLEKTDLVEARILKQSQEPLSTG
ncbi:MAG: TIGR03960 family B12-binding radical SAM protein [Desulfosarcinaceae bacterium]|nr:TIGR03960 family B12-binding radical SAM protein [Desulfosarcinaceae bacterium]